MTNESRQRDDERRSLIAALDLRLAAVRFGDATNDREPEARAGGTCREERLEETRLELVRDAVTVVGHGDAHSVAIARRLDGDGLRPVRRLERVREQIDERFADELRVALHDGDLVVDIDDHFGVLVTRRLRGTERTLDERPQLRSRHVERVRALIEGALGAA